MYWSSIQIHFDIADLATEQPYYLHRSLPHPIRWIAPVAIDPL
ncbi:Uncharacterised protein [Vibrio cholerae]|nr:Uncharacterised protein [Vibrio cholerae]